MTYICVNKLTIIGSDNGLSPGGHQANIWTNVGILLIWTLGTNFSEILREINVFSFKKIHIKCLLQNGGNFVSASMHVPPLLYSLLKVIFMIMKTSTIMWIAYKNLYTPAQRSCWGGGRGILVSLCPSVHPSVSSVRSVVPTVLVGSISYVYILSSNFRRFVVSLL